VSALVDAAYASAAAADASSEAAAAGSTPPPPPPAAAARRRWFRPGHGWFNHGVLAAAKDAGHTVVLGSIWPWDTHVSCAYLNALYCWLKAYSGAIIVLHDKWVAGAAGAGHHRALCTLPCLESSRQTGAHAHSPLPPLPPPPRRGHTVKTLEYLLPWLKRSGYDVVTLSEAAEAVGGADAEAAAAAQETTNQQLLADSAAALGAAAGKGGDAGEAGDDGAEEASGEGPADPPTSPEPAAPAPAAAPVSPAKTSDGGEKKLPKLFKSMSRRRSKQSQGN
jgi:hypothetical protein